MTPPVASKRISICSKFVLATPVIEFDVPKPNNFPRFFASMRSCTYTSSNYDADGDEDEAVLARDVDAVSSSLQLD